MEGRRNRPSFSSSGDEPRGNTGPNQDKDRGEPCSPSTLRIVLIEDHAQRRITCQAQANNESAHERYATVEEIQ